MRALESFARSWRAGSILSVPCGRSVPRQLTIPAPDCLLTGRMPSFPEEPMRAVEQRNGIWRLSLERIEATVADHLGSGRVLGIRPPHV